MVAGKNLRGLALKLDMLHVQNALVEWWSNNEKTPLTVSKPWRLSCNPSAQIWPLDLAVAPNDSRWILPRSARSWLCDLIGPYQDPGGYFVTLGHNYGRWM